MGDLFDFSNYGELLLLVQNSIYAGALLGVVGGLIGVFVMMRDLPFAVHGISELSFAGASAALLLGANVVIGSTIGSLLAALLIGVLGVRARERNSIIAVLMPFGLGLGILFLALYEGRSANKFGLLTGQIVSVDNEQLGVLIGISLLVVIGLVIMWRPLTFASVDADVARARGLPVTALSVAFMVLLGLCRGAARDGAARHTGRRRNARDLVAAAHAAAECRVRRRGDGRRHPPRPRRRAADQPVRHHDLVPHLRRLPRRRGPDAEDEALR